MIINKKLYKNNFLKSKIYKHIIIYYNLKMNYKRINRYGILMEEHKT